VVNIRVAEQGFPLESKDNDIVNLVKSFEPITNAILAKVDVDEILHARLDPLSVGCTSSTSNHD
jgi:hypothetical protein